ncbi:MAG: CehA/McbA family metallohydrolase, partial [Polyangiaceae bacterium]
MSGSRWAVFGAALAFAVAFVASCSHGAGGGGGAAAAASASGGSSGGTGLQPPAGMWLKGDLHVHTTHSGDAQQYGDDIATVIRCCERAGLDFTTISDHRNGACLTDPQFTGAQTSLVLIPGTEWGGSGHAGAHGITRDPIYYSETGATAADIVKNTQAAIDDVHSMGGIFVLNHAIDDKCPWLWPVDRFDAIEVWNQPWALRNVTDQTAADLQTWIAQRGMGGQSGVMPPPEVSAAIAVRGGGQNWQRLHLYEAYLSSGHHIAAVGGSDAHYLVLPGSPTTEVFAAARTRDAILDAIREGHTQVARAPDAPTLDFTADRDGDGIFETIVGDRVPLGRPVTFKMHVVGAQGGRIDL